MAGERSRTFEQLVPVILDRWTVERTTRLTADEIEQVRQYLRRCGVRAHPVDGGRFVLEKTGRVVEPEHLV